LRGAAEPQPAVRIIKLLSELPENSVYTLLKELSDTGVIVRSGARRGYCYALAPEEPSA
jgi:DNA-binding IclR family transcriptional regulator